MNDYHIARIYARMEDEMTASMKRNLQRHLAEEQKVGVEYTQWQAVKLKELKRYQRQNQSIINRRVIGLPRKVSAILMDEFKQGTDKISKDSFFRVNDKKIEVLIGTINNDLKKAEHAVLRKANDEYRRVIHEAAMLKSHGVFTEKQAIAKAIKAFEQRGLRSVEYSNGAKHLISDYAGMAVRTASQRAQLMGEGEFRRSIGETLIKITKHGTACPLCQPWESKVLIDDVYSGGKKSDGSYPLLSEAMGDGLFHPRCRHGTSTHYSELEDEQKALSQSSDAQKGLPEGRERGNISPGEQLKDFLDDFRVRHGVGIDAAVYGLDCSSIKESLSGIESALKEFPQATGSLKAIGVYNAEIMSTHYVAGSICFNPAYYQAGSTGAADIIKQGVADGFFAKSATTRSAGAHEVGHILEKALIDQQKYKAVSAKIKTWNSGEKAKLVIEEASVKAIKTKEGKGLTKEILIGQVSGYAKENYSEALAECVTDYMDNGSNSAPLSREVWKILKRKLG